MNIFITQPGNNNFHHFDDILKQLYPAESVRHQQPENLNPEFLLKCYILIQDGIPKARAALYNNPNLLFKGNRSTCIGNYECVNDKEIANNLLDYIIEDCKGFVFCYDDLYNVNEKNLVIKTIARNESKKWSGLGQILYNRIICKAKSKGYDSLIHAFMIEEGSSTKISKRYQGEFYKTYKLYGKPI